jgi:plasmid stabilization system protein ParE
VPELARPTIREVIQGNYRIVYRVTTDRLEILAIVHGARDFPTSSF